MPSPASYNIPSLFKPDSSTSTFANHSKGSSFCFGTGREDFKKTVVNFDKQYPDPDNPGPNMYTDLKPLGSEKAAVSLKSKIDFFRDERIARKAGVPGAGHYEAIDCMDSLGKYKSSLTKNSQAQRWSKDEVSQRPPALATVRNPGPGTYATLGNIAEMHQNVSIYPTMKTRTFGNEGKPEWASAFQSPGPAAYRLPSDFGYVTLSPKAQAIMLATNAYTKKPINYLRMK